MKGNELFRALRRRRDNGDEERLVNIAIGRILPNPAQPRKDFGDAAMHRLAESIRRYGILQPLTVRPAGELPKDTVLPREALFYELIAGERRLRAARLAGLREVPCRIREADDRRSAELTVIEDLHREDLALFEQAEAIASLIDVYGLTQEEAAATLGLSQTAVAAKLRLLRLTPAERQIFCDSHLTERHAAALLQLSDADQRLQLLREIAKNALSASEAEAMVDRILCPVDENGEPPKRRQLVLKDMRIFYNTLDRAVETIEKAGIEVTKDRRDLGDRVEMVICVRKRTLLDRDLPLPRPLLPTAKGTADPSKPVA